MNDTDAPDNVVPLFSDATKVEPGEDLDHVITKLVTQMKRMANEIARLHNKLELTQTKLINRQDEVEALKAKIVDELYKSLEEEEEKQDG